MLRVSVCACVCWTKQKVFVKVCRARFVARSLALFISYKNALFALTRLGYRCDSAALSPAAASRRFVLFVVAVFNFFLRCVWFTLCCCACCCCRSVWPQHFRCHLLLLLLCLWVSISLSLSLSFYFL